MEKSNEINVLHFSNIPANNSSGVYNVIEQIVSSQKKQGVYSLNVNLNELKFTKFIFEYLVNNLITVNNSKVELKSVDIVVFHEVYQPVYAFLYRKLQRLGIPYIVVPHGSLTSNAISQKRIKKTIFLSTFIVKFLSSANGFQYLSIGEFQSTPDKFHINPFIIPNGVITIDKPITRKNSTKLNFTFISRKSIHHKGLDIFLESLLSIKEELANSEAVISIYGPDVEESKAYLERYISTNGMENVVKIFQPVYGIDKDLALKNTHVFFLTSRSEGLPISVLEALSYGVPVLISHETNLGEYVKKYNAGWVTELSVNEIKFNILRILENKNSLNEFSINAKELSKVFDWGLIAKQTIEVYYKIINGGF